MTRVFLGALDSAGYLPVIRQGLEWTGTHSRLKAGDRVCIKPNLTFPEFRPGVMTNPECLEALLIALGDHGTKVTIVEADSGGYNRFRIDEVFEKIGLYELGRRYGAKVLNLSDLPSRTIQVTAGRREIAVPLPCLLLDECDFFITVPVPKVHCNTLVSLAVKNQWGCIPLPKARLELHPYFPEVIYGVNHALRPALALVDGRYGLNRNGPMLGDPVELNWVMLADDIYSADWIGCRLMRINPATPRHMRYLRKVGALPTEDRIVLNEDYHRFQRDQFYLHRKWTDYPGLVAFRSRTAAYWAYESPLAGFLHRLLYLVREPFY